MQCVKTPNSGLYYPSLITALCHKASVPYDTNKELLHPKHALDNNTFLSIKSWEDNPKAGPSIGSSRPPQQPYAQNLPVTDRLAMLESSFEDHSQELRQLSHRFD